MSVLWSRLKTCASRYVLVRLRAAVNLQAFGPGRLTIQNLLNAGLGVEGPPDVSGRPLGRSIGDFDDEQDIGDTGMRGRVIVLARPQQGEVGFRLTVGEADRIMDADDRLARLTDA